MWSLTRRFAFRAFASFVLLRFALWPLGSLPGTGLIRERLFAAGDRIVPWVGAHLLGLRVTRIMNGSGDTVFHWISLATTAAAALLVAVVWSLVDRAREGYGGAFRWLRVYVRLFLASALLSYGAAKVVGGQFPALDTYRLVEPLGQMSPMGLFWAAMGFSRAYQAFGGWCEVAAGLLLLWGPSATAGALLAVAVLANVVMVNFCFDVPVKLHSLELLVYALFVLLPDLSFLAQTLLLRRAAPLPEVEPPALERRWLNLLQRAVLAVAACIPVFFGWQAQASTRRWVGKSPPAMSGAWRVEHFEGGLFVPAWEKVVISDWGTATVQSADDSSARMSLTVVGWDSRELVLLPREPAGPTINGLYEQPDPDRLIFRVSLDGAPAEIRLRRIKQEFPLVRRGFHWVNEAPFNR